MEELLIKIQEAKEKSIKIQKALFDFEDTLITSFQHMLGTVKEITPDKSEMQDIAIGYTIETLLKQSINFLQQLTAEKGKFIPDGYFEKLKEMNSDLNKQLTVLEFYESN